MNLFFSLACSGSPPLFQMRGTPVPAVVRRPEHPGHPRSFRCGEHLCCFLSFLSLLAWVGSPPLLPWEPKDRIRFIPAPKGCGGTTI